jgi:2-iminobutanoate/2-iminopropanoate deaminase
MGSVESLQPPGVADPLGHLSNATRVGSRLYVAGLVSVDEKGDLVGRGSARDQTLHVCSVLEGICEHYGAGLEDVARCLVFLAHRSDYAEYDAAFAQAFGEHRPARATVIAELVGEEFLVEIVSDVELPT